MAHKGTYLPTYRVVAYAAPQVLEDMRALIDGVKAIKKSVCTPFLPACRPRTSAPSGAHCAGHDVHVTVCCRCLTRLRWPRGPTSRSTRRCTRSLPRLPRRRRALNRPRASAPLPICAGPLRISSRTRSRRWDSATSALGLGHVYAGTARRWRSWRRRALGCARGAPLRMSCHVPVSASHHLCPFVRRRCASSA